MSWHVTDQTDVAETTGKVWAGSDGDHVVGIQICISTSYAEVIWSVLQSVDTTGSQSLGWDSTDESGWRGI